MNTATATPHIDTAAPPHYTSEETRTRIFAIMAASSGNLVEWFDFYIYAFGAIYFASAFFPKSDPTAQLLNTAGVFAAGFLMRPLGGWIFGRIADRRGRRTSLLVSVGLMCGGSLLIAALPTYASVGAWAPALLLLARLIQGISVGGEYGATATYMSEVALRGQRGFLSSFQYVTLIGGQLLAVLVIGGGTAMLAAGFLGPDAVVRIRGQQRLDDDLFGRVIDFGDEVVRLLLRDADGLDVERSPVDDRAGGAGGLDGHVEHGMQVGRRHGLL